MTTVRLFRDILIGESGGQKVSEYNTQESIPKMLDEAYNAGVDHTLELVEAWWKERLPNITQLKERIQSLKK